MTTESGETVVKSQKRPPGSVGCGVQFDGLDECDGYAPCLVCEPELFGDGDPPDLTDPGTAGWVLEWLPSGWSVFDRLAIDGGRSVVIKLRGAVSIAYEGPSIGEAAASALLAHWGPA
jgi:hypothetical protein